MIMEYLVYNLVLAHLSAFKPLAHLYRASYK